MKRLLSTVLLAFIVFGAWAQNKTKMTEEEKKEADGAVSKVEITSSPHPALSETVTDCIYRMRFMPAKYDGECVASVAIISVLF